MEEKNYFQKENFQIIKEELDNTGLDSVYKSFNIDNRQEKFLCKLINKKTFKKNPKNEKDLIETIILHSKLKNDKIVHLSYYIQGSTNIYLFFDYMEGKTALKYIKEGKNYKEKDICIII